MKLKNLSYKHKSLFVFIALMLLEFVSATIFTDPENSTGVMIKNIMSLMLVVSILNLLVAYVYDFINVRFLKKGEKE